MRYLIGNMRLITTIAFFGVMLVTIELAPVAPSGWGPVGFGVSPAMAGSLVCDCTTAAAADTAASKTKDDADKVKEDAEKVTLCHAPPGNPNNEHTLRVGESAVDAHINHHPLLLR